MTFCNKGIDDWDRFMTEMTFLSESYARAVIGKATLMWLDTYLRFPLQDS
jgi:hypothetical protein